MGSVQTKPCQVAYDVGLMEFAVLPVDSVLHLPRKVKRLEECLRNFKFFGGLVRMAFRPVHHSHSLLKWQPRKLLIGFFCTLMGFSTIANDVMSWFLLFFVLWLKYKLHLCIKSRLLHQIVIFIFYEHSIFCFQRPNNWIVVITTHTCINSCFICLLSDIWSLGCVLYELLTLKHAVSNSFTNTFNNYIPFNQTPFPM